MRNYFNTILQGEKNQDLLKSCHCPNVNFLQTNVKITDVVRLDYIHTFILSTYLIKWSTYSENRRFRTQTISKIFLLLVLKVIISVLVLTVHALECVDVVCVCVCHALVQGPALSAADGGHAVLDVQMRLALYKRLHRFRTDRTIKMCV